VNRAGQNYYLKVLTPIAVPSVPSLRASLEALPAADASPFARLATTHFVRLVVLERLGAEGAGERVHVLDPPLLYLDANFSDDVDHWIDELVRTIPDTVDAVWRHAIDYPGLDQPERFRRYLRAHQLSSHMCLATSADAALDEVLRGLAARAKLIELATTTQQLAPDALRRTVMAGLGAR
jgi:hypothetical protein